MGGRTCIGTTDTPVKEPTQEVTPDDRAFILKNVNALLNLETPITESDIISERCGVRPLVISGQVTTTPDWMQLSRKHAVEPNLPESYLTIFGGKLTDCLNVGMKSVILSNKWGFQYLTQTTSGMGNLMMKPGIGLDIMPN